MADTEVELDSLVGDHTLDAVDTYVEQVKSYGNQFADVNCIRFRLDGIVYTAAEDPSDGYRSSLERLFSSPVAEVRNVFAPHRVIVSKKPDEEYAVSDALIFTDAVTGKIVLEVGTNNTDDYYPSFVGAFFPENMAANAAKTANADDE